MARMLWDFLVFTLLGSHYLDLSTQHLPCQIYRLPLLLPGYEINRGWDTVPSITCESPSYSMAAQELTEQMNE